ncbi:WXG100 family type VII secretion target [Ruicaihuangia caeni]|uniref:WXG100 family type VII secretion target n=1 Tax=Ruicaihuangia caeni TaxID=3042517 RepID=A0AAW6T2S1_9MICO|nr:WXG100 family type VII secretion target [Klugiella sp. YN-L-19]MDI2098106.1 WXG100 family type VII secretion target [Klugiella sp. YN-L-19]
MAISGDLEQLFALQNTLTRNSGTVEELTTSIRNELNNVRWEGPAADRFRATWTGEFEPGLRRLREAIDDAAAEVSRRREALAQAGN